MIATRRILVALAVIGASTTAPSQAQSELEKYLAERRAAAMTEGAEGQIRTVAGLLAGSSVLLIERDPDGSYTRSYTTALCLRPGTDSPEQRRLAEELRQRAETEFQRLRPLADFDHSGFVTGEEGTRLRYTIELGLIAEQLPTEGLTAADVANALGRSRDWVANASVDYEQIRQQLDQLQGTRLPALPSVILVAADNTRAFARALPLNSYAVRRRGLHW